MNEGQISIKDIIELRLNLDNLKETETTKQINAALDEVILNFAKGLMPATTH